MVMDTGFNSEANRRALQGGGDAAYQGSDIIGEKMRLGRDGSQREALSRPGRYKALAGGLSFNEVIDQQWQRHQPAFCDRSRRRASQAGRGQERRHHPGGGVRAARA